MCETHLGDRALALLEGLGMRGNSGSVPRSGASSRRLWFLEGVAEGGGGGGIPGGENRNGSFPSSQRS